MNVYIVTPPNGIHASDVLPCNILRRGHIPSLHGSCNVNGAVASKIKGINHAHRVTYLLYAPHQLSFHSSPDPTHRSCRAYRHWVHGYDDNSCQEIGGAYGRKTYLRFSIRWHWECGVPGDGVMVLVAVFLSFLLRSLKCWPPTHEWLWHQKVA